VIVKNKTHSFSIHILPFNTFWLDLGRLAHRTSDIGNIEAKLNSEELVVNVPIPMLGKMNVKNCNTVFALIMLKHHTFII